MSIIQIQNLTFGYDNHYQSIFENVSLTLDTDWRLGLIGRNGRGKTTFAQLLLGKFPYSGTISASVAFDYFPFPVPGDFPTARETVKNCIAPYAQWERALDNPGDLTAYGDALEQYLAHDGYQIDAHIDREAALLEIPPDALERPFSTLSGGEQAKLMLCALFLKQNRFLLIDEPTNHLDLEGRRALGRYLAGKKGFILISHDRALLDTAVNHILSINRSTIELQKGNYTTWKQNRDRQDQFERDENARLKREIGAMARSAAQKSNWSDSTERSKIGSHAGDRGFIGHKAAKMMQRAKSIERRQEAAIAQKETLLKDIEEPESLQLHPLDYPKPTLFHAQDLCVDYGGGPLFAPQSFVVKPGARIGIRGSNGAGKSSILKLLAGQPIPHTGTAQAGSGLVVSYVPQDTAFLRGSLAGFAQSRGLDEPLFLAILRKLDFARTQFEKDMADFSQGQKKKVLLAASLAAQAHLYVWDEPLNYLDIPSREQMEALLLQYAPTLVFVEHDAAFFEKIATQIVYLERNAAI